MTQTNSINSHQVGRPATSRLHSCLELILIVIFGLPFLCGVMLVIDVLWDNVWGSVIEWVTHYPNSELIRVDYGAYGSNDMQTKIYLRWTADTAANVSAYYDRFPMYRSHAKIIDTKDATSKLTACAWHIGFYHQYDNEMENHPCSLAVRLIDERGGTIIEFAHDYWAG